MPLTRLDIADFRNLGTIKLASLSHGFNFLYGNNGSGKTSVLEAIYYLSRGRSFRSSLTTRIINHQADKFALFAHIQSQHQQNIPIGIERQRNGDSMVRIAGEEAQSMADLVVLTPVLLINSNCYNLLDAGPVFRRKYLDWCLFYLAPDFLPAWKQYSRALKQRNAALRARISKQEFEAWNIELIQSAIKLDAIRRDVVKMLLPVLLETVKVLLPHSEVDITYLAGWDESESYEQVLMQSIAKDIAAGYTQFGPHRADLKMIINRIPAKDILSRGQQKLFVCAMIVAQGALLQQCVNRKPIYLVDDLPSELDAVSRSNLIALLSRQEAQVFLTAVEHETLKTLFNKAPMKMFHVEHGKVTEAMVV